MPKSTEDKFNPINSIKLFGYDSYFATLAKLYQNGKFPKVILLTGEKGSGKFTLAFHLVNFFFTNKSKDSYDLKNLTINIQNNFYKKILSNVNENFTYIGKNESKKVSVEEIRDIKKKFNTTSLNNLPRFTIFDDSDLLNSNSANALLKLIEEPSDLNYFILINNKRRKIIDTLKSRSLEVKIFLKKKEKENILKNLSEKFGVNLDSYSDFTNKTTPGTFLRACECLKETRIDETKNLYNSTEILLDKFKKDKNEKYIEAIRFLLDFQIDKKLKIKNDDFLKISFLKKNIIKLLFEYENFNLSKNSVLESLKTLPEHA
tara:strand:- start:1160 stop:2113 length:954 start_codon:yes stop_codon:yes gene_type:complete